MSFSLVANLANTKALSSKPSSVYSRTSQINDKTWTKVVKNVLCNMSRRSEDHKLQTSVLFSHNRNVNIEEKLPAEKLNEIINSLGRENFEHLECNCDSHSRGQPHLLLTFELLRTIALKHQQDIRIPKRNLQQPLDLQRVFNEPLITKNKIRLQNKYPDNLLYIEHPSRLVRKVAFKRKFIIQNQSPQSNDILHLELSDGLLFDPVWSNCSSDFFGKGRQKGSFACITSKGFRSWSIGNLLQSHSSFYHEFINTKGLCGFNFQDPIPLKIVKSASSKLIEDRKFVESINVLHLVSLRSIPPSRLNNTLRKGSNISEDSLEFLEMGLYNNNSENQTHPPPSLMDLYNKVFAEEIYDPIDENVIHSNLAYYNDEPLNEASLEVNKPSIMDFKVTIGHRKSKNFDETKSSSSFHESNFSVQSDEDFLFKFDHNEPLFREKECKKFVTFTPETIFIERDADSPFWKGFYERKKLRQLYRQRRLLKNQSRRLTFFDIVKLFFTSRKSMKKESVNAAKSQDKKASELIEENVDGTDLNLIQYQIASSNGQNYIQSREDNVLEDESKLTRIKTLLNCSCCTCTCTHLRND